MGYNPISWVGGEGNAIPAPSSYQWGEQDVSSSEAGRTEDGTMFKNKMGSVVKLNLEWKNISTSEASKILKAFTEKEYFQVRYLDPKEGGFCVRTFYIGDRSAPLYSTVPVIDGTEGVWSNISFNIIERGGGWNATS